MSFFFQPKPAPFDTIQVLLAKANETLIAKFPMAGQLAPAPFDTIQVLLYKLVFNLNLVPSTGGAAAYSGSGSPEGAVTASVGSLYWDFTNDALYVKDTGTGSTGWKVLIS